MSSTSAELVGPSSTATQSHKINFHGRLGYACLNMYLRNQKPSVFCSRTCRLETVKEKGMEHVKELGRQNAKDLLALVKFNEEHNIKFMRVSSQMFPFASHEEYGYSLDYCKEELQAVGQYAAKFGHRLTMHPGQYTQLGSPKENVVRKSIRDLSYHAELLDLMGSPPDSIMIIHMGGTFGDKEETFKRFEVNYKELPEPIKKRLVLENDETCYNVQELLPLCQKMSIPLVLDWHHHSINPGTLLDHDLLKLISAINKTWTDRGLKPKQHYSETRRGAQTAMEMRAHSDRVVKLPPCDPDMDLMIEAKDKEQAVFQLYQIYNLNPVDPSVLLPAAEIESTQTKGRKSSKKKKVVQMEQIEINEIESTHYNLRKSSRKKKTVEIEEQAETNKTESMQSNMRKSLRKKKVVEIKEETKGETEINQVKTAQTEGKKSFKRKVEQAIINVEGKKRPKRQLSRK
ncbi:hypothetical protein G9A89_013859 [Geosiphon pyriformis]|nr:hypothetical protein G9A89_013859 [Geosiphon pyriformis]